MTYTVLSLLGVMAAVALDLLLLRTRLLGRKAFWAAYAILLVGQLATNAVLAGRRVVRYDPDAIVGLRIAWAPVEDLLFGFALVLLTLSLWVFWGRRGVQREPSAGPPRWR